MFETETEKHCNEAICSNCGHPREGEGNCGVVCHEWRDEYDTFKEGAEFGYNKANEWHYMKDELPQEMQEVIICIKDEKRITRAKRIKNDLWTSPREDFNTKEIIAWKEFVLPKESE